MTDSATITVNVMGTFSEKNRPNNGLERVARYLIENRLSHVPVVCEVGFHKLSETLDGTMLTIKLLATEPGVAADGSDPHGHAKRIRELLDELRRGMGKSAFEETLFSVPREGFDFDGPDEDKPAAELDGQQEIRLGPDGPREVPPPSAEEELAERAEAKAGAQSAKPGAKSGAKSAKPTATPFAPGPDDAA